MLLRKPLLTLYTLWAAFCFVFLYLLIFPFQYIFLQKPAWKPRAHACNRLWAHLFFPLVGMPVEVEYRGQRPDPDRAYVFTPNHFSYLDIAVMMYPLPHYFAFMGKREVRKIPLLGYMFAKLHIQVNRHEAASRAKAMQKSVAALRGGRSMVIFPEGGIKAATPPTMHHPFKDGAFKMAIDQQVPVVPVTLADNHRRLPDKGRQMRLHPGRVRVIIHEPIPTAGLSEADLPALREKVFRILQESLYDTNGHRRPA